MSSVGLLDKTTVVNEQKGEESAGIEERKLSEMRHERAKSERGIFCSALTSFGSAISQRRAKMNKQRKR